MHLSKGGRGGGRRGFGLDGGRGSSAKKKRLVESPSEGPCGLRKGKRRKTKSEILEERRLNAKGKFQKND